MAILLHAGAAQRAGRLGGQRRRPGQYLLVGPIPPTLAVRSWLRRPIYDPLASHLSLPTGGTKLGPCSLVWTAPAAPAETSSGANANGVPGKICHLQLDYRARSPWRQRALWPDARVQVPPISGAVLSRLRRPLQLPPSAFVSANTRRLHVLCAATTVISILQAA